MKLLSPARRCLIILFSKVAPSFSRSRVVRYLDKSLHFRCKIPEYFGCECDFYVCLWMMDALNFNNFYGQANRWKIKLSKEIFWGIFLSDNVGWAIKAPKVLRACELAQWIPEFLLIVIVFSDEAARCCWFSHRILICSDLQYYDCAEFQIYAPVN